MTGLDASTRLGIISGLVHFGEGAPSWPAVGVALTIGLLVAGLLLAGRRVLRPADWASAAIAVLVLGGLFVPAQVYDHYAYFSAAFLALLGGVCGGLIAAASSRLITRGSDDRVRVIAMWLPVALVVVGAALSLPSGIGGARSYFADATDPGDVVRETIPAGACIVTDDPVLLIAGDRGWQPRHDCPQLVDPFGLWLTEANGSLPHVDGAIPIPPAFVQKWAAWLSQADYVVLSVPGSDYLPFSADLVSQFNSSFRLLAAGEHAFVYVRIA
jgi:hypothetical protein